ncbi:hypothetical protein PK35_09985 [Tamlana nanhaiensis]|uniref:Isomerase n=1 Tax=Neotamlana nanhaiensis TaxID=1382798 RepID=A0A0D7W062_9FLAO|nr:PhzF family phenazine biosynthesis isomerase [Tamlana nanhaiensis]KJD32525.1 hypothetical protein PK35_09985 [Tamlana nanhaiensis]
MRLFTIDAFTNTPFKGNPAAVCVLDEPLTEAEYIDIAQEMNLSETAYVYLENGEYQLRWFTPEAEIDLCGHATLATAKVLFDIYNVAQEELAFNTRSGILTVKQAGKFLEMNFPIGYLNQVSNEDALSEEALGAKPVEIWQDKSWCLIKLENDEALKNLTPNFNLLKTHQQTMFIVTAKSSDVNYDFLSRFFGPSVGINEDPVTGSAHCYLASYWSEVLNKKTLKAHQASKRGGDVFCEVVENNRVLLRGESVIMSEIKSMWTK